MLIVSQVQWPRQSILKHMRTKKSQSVTWKLSVDAAAAVYEEVAETKKEGPTSSLEEVNQATTTIENKSEADKAMADNNTGVQDQPDAVPQVDHSTPVTPSPEPQHEGQPLVATAGYDKISENMKDETISSGEVNKAAGNNYTDDYFQRQGTPEQIETQREHDQMQEVETKDEINNVEHNSLMVQPSTGEGSANHGGVSQMNTGEHLAEPGQDATIEDWQMKKRKKKKEKKKKKKKETETVEEVLETEDFDTLTTFHLNCEVQTWLSLILILMELHWLPVEFRIQYKVLLHVYRTLNGLSPGYLADMLERHVPTHSLRSTDSMSLTVPQTRHRWGDRAFSGAGPVLWNDLPLAVRSASSLASFKKTAKNTSLH